MNVRTIALSLILPALVLAAGCHHTGNRSNYPPTVVSAQPAPRPACPNPVPPPPPVPVGVNP